MSTGTILLCDGLVEGVPCGARSEVLPDDVSFAGARGWMSLRSRPYLGGTDADRQILLCPTCAVRIPHAGIQADVTA